MRILADGQQPPARPEHPARLREEPRAVGEMMEGVDAENAVEGRVAPRQVFSPRPDEAR
jgi:hypothetical protein